MYEDPRHRSFYFFLTLASRDLWFTNRGYGLADTGTGSALVVTTESVEGFSATRHVKSLESLHERFVYLFELWEQLGSRYPEDYTLSFVPKTEPPVTEPDSGMMWIIERPYFWEIVRLSEGERA